MGFRRTEWTYKSFLADKRCFHAELDVRQRAIYLLSKQQAHKRDRNDGAERGNKRKLSGILRIPIVFFSKN